MNQNIVKITKDYDKLSDELRLKGISSNVPKRKLSNMFLNIYGEVWSMNIFYLDRDPKIAGFQRNL